MTSYVLLQMLMQKHMHTCTCSVHTCSMHMVLAYVIGQELGMDWSLREGYAWAEDKEHCEEYGRMLNANPAKVCDSGMHARMWLGARRPQIYWGMFKGCV